MGIPHERAHEVQYPTELGPQHPTRLDVTSFRDGILDWYSLGVAIPPLGDSGFFCLTSVNSEWTHQLNPYKYPVSAKVICPCETYTAS